MVTARLGVTWDRALLYVKGGYAGATVKASIVDLITNTAPVQVGTAPNTWNTDEWHNGGTAGIGMDVKLWSNLSLGIEYNYVWLQERTHSAQVLNAGATPIGPASYAIKPDVQTLIARLNFHLWSPPVVGKY